MGLLSKRLIMINVYLDPFSYIFLANNQFGTDSIPIRDDMLLPWQYLKNYCQENNINLNTIDFWNKNIATKEDIYISLDHKNLIRKLFWHFKNGKYPFVKLSNFKKKILFLLESPLSQPQPFKNINNLFKTYDRVYCWHKFSHSKSFHCQYIMVYSGISPAYWQNTNRKFMTMINSNKKFHGISQKPNKKNYLFYYKELVNERLKAIEFFSRTGEIDLYGRHWDNLSPFLSQVYKSAIKKAGRGRVEAKYQKLSEYQFAICFENCIAPGYISEKIFDCFYVGTIPVYLGSPDITNYMPKQCFIDMRDFKNYTDLRNFLKSLSKSDIENYRNNARQFLESEKFKPFTKEYFAEKFVNLVKE